MNGAVPARPGEKPIEKRILHAGRGPEQHFSDGTKLRFHFVTKCGDKTLDDSRKWDNPMELLIGKKFKLEAWELCLQTMRVHEVASFKVHIIYSAAYPTVAKTLRDTFNKNAKPKPVSSHMCGMMAMQSEGSFTGYEDLDELIKKPQELEFIMELLSVELPDTYVKESWQMDAEEKLDSVTKLRLEGNEFYREKKLVEASDKYADAVGRLEQLLLREKPQDEEWVALRKQKVPLLLNYAQCKLSLEDYYAVIEHCTEVLEIEPDNVKGLYRRGKAHIGAWNPNQARADFERIIELDPTLKGACMNELKHLELLVKSKDNEDKNKLKKLFQ